MNYNPYSLEGKTILVTGASSGIGQTTAIECSKLGATLIITGRNEQRLAETFAQLEGEGHQQITADLTISEDIDKLVNFVPQLDGLVNNAGISKVLPIQFINESDLKNIFQTNTFAPILVIRLLYKKKKFNKNASVVFTSSIAGNQVITYGNTIYGMAKNAINSFLRYSALEFSARGMRCNGVNPGMIETPLINSGVFTQEDREKDIAKYPLKRYGKPTDVAYGIIYLLSDASSWVTGTSLVIDGGITI
jgi:NAD(P)-dependent dehydrogenase (short-subunit alcohol dehydrogenase family)